MYLTNKKRSSIKVLVLAITILLLSSFSYQDRNPGRCIVPVNIRELILNEFSGEAALRHVEILSIDRDRQADEYENMFFEAKYISDMAKQYGLSEVKVDFVPSGETWDVEEADLWLIEPVRKKIAGMHIIPEAIASGSKNTDVETEVVFVGSGRNAYEGLDVKGKIVIGNSSVGGLYSQAVGQHGAVGALGTGSAGVNSNYVGYSEDQIGWQSIRGGGDSGFGFVLSKRQFEEIRRYLERGQKVVMRAHIKSKMYPYRMNINSAAILGTDPNAGEFIMVSHSFERLATPGANDNCSGVATMLEIARTLNRLIEDGDLPRPKRTIRFLWVPEISGSRAFMYKYPELEDKLLAAMNFDMSGADLELTDSYLRMKTNPDSHASYMDNLIENLLLYVDQTDIRTQWGNNSPFNYRMVPYISGSDHTIFHAGGIPAMQFNHWTDNFYHSSEDRSKYVDPTELKRCGFVAAAGFYYMAIAGEKEAGELAWESSAGGDKWMAEVSRQSIRLLGNDKEKIHERYKAAQNKVYGAMTRGITQVNSVLELSDTKNVKDYCSQLVENLESMRTVYFNKLEIVYNEKCKQFGIVPKKITQTADEKKYDKIIPLMKYNYYSQEYRDASRSNTGGRSRGGGGMPRSAGSEITGFINGERSITDIYNLVRAEYGNVTTGNTERKFAYEVTPKTSDVELKAVVDYIEAMEKAGLVEIKK
ncbi:M28 family peptidase [Bacteroidota bacterium]